MKVRLQDELKPKSAITAIQILRGRKKFKKTSKTNIFLYYIHNVMEKKEEMTYLYICIYIEIK